MRTCPDALKKIQEHFAPVGLTINIIPLNEFSNPNGWFGPQGNLLEDFTVKRPDRYVLEVSDVVAIGFLLHEAMHTLLARPAWDHTLSGCTYNWTQRGSIIAEEHPIVVYGRHIIQSLDIQEAATESSAVWEDATEITKRVKGKRKVVSTDRQRLMWKQPGGDLMSHDNMGTPTETNIAKTINTLKICGVTDARGKLIGPFNPDMSNNKIKKLMKILNLDDVLGLVPQIGSPADIATLKKAA